MSITSNGQATATVEVLTAEVYVLKVGSRQVTLSVYRQLDWAAPGEVEAFGRVSDKQDEPGYVYVVGRHIETGALVCSSRQVWPRPWDLAVSNLIVAWHGRTGATIDVDGAKATISFANAKACEGKAVQRPDGSDGCTRLGHVGEPVTWYAGDKQRGCPFSWHWKSPDAQAQVEHDVRQMRAELADMRAAAQEWQALPLIVLAGLR